MAFTQAQLDALDQAIATGALRVAYDGKSVQYRSLEEMRLIRDQVRRELGLAAGDKPKQTRIIGRKDS